MAATPLRPETAKEQKRQDDALRVYAAAVNLKRAEKQQTSAPSKGGARR